MFQYTMIMTIVKVIITCVTVNTDTIFRKFNKGYLKVFRSVSDRSQFKVSRFQSDVSVVNSNNKMKTKLVFVDRCKEFCFAGAPKVMIKMVLTLIQGGHVQV